MSDWALSFTLCFTSWTALWVCLTLATSSLAVGDDVLSGPEFEMVQAVEQKRIKAIQKVIGSVIAIYDEDRKGGGSGVIIDPSGIALTNHHVIIGSGITGWGGLADGKMYKWKLIGTDPGGDLSIIQMEGRDDFPFTPLGDSDKVQVGDWALAMGNPFILTEDQSPTVTLGIVSGVKRYQPGAGANQLVYGNCIQVDSSINPGNSGGPLFNFNAEVIGINGRGSFKERGRVNVGLGYAISANQIKNFIPDLLATKLVEHATLDASFSERGGKVVCSQLSLDAPVAKAGLQLGDELIEFEGSTIKNANQFTNLICTLPEDWPTELRIRDKSGVEKDIVVRTFGLPYKKPKPPRNRPDKKKPTPEQEKQQKRQREMVELLSAPSGEIRFTDINQGYAKQLISSWKELDGPTEKLESNGVVKIVDQVSVGDSVAGNQTMWLATDGRVRIELDLENGKEEYVFDGTSFFATKDGKTKKLTLVESKLNLPLVQAIAMLAVLQETPFASYGETYLDGSDKALGQNAFRFRKQDNDADDFFFWLRMFGDDGRPATRLVKASAHKDCESTGGVTFHDWESVGPVLIPKRREFISGLREVTSWKLVNESAQWLSDVDESWFAATEVAPEGKSDAAVPNSDTSVDSGSQAKDVDEGNVKEDDVDQGESDDDVSGTNGDKESP